MKKYLHLLERLGMNEEERKIYMTLLEHPYLTITDISSRSGYHRPVVYTVIRSLESEGLVAKSYLEGKRYYYHVTSPEKLKEKLHTLNILAENTLPELEAIYKKSAHAPILSIQEGIEGIRSIHKEVIEKTQRGGIYYRFSSSRDTYEGKSLYTPEGYEEAQVKKELERVIITNKKQSKKRSGNPNREVITLPEGFDSFEDNITKIIYGDIVAIIDYDSETAWTIESERFARYEEKIFRLIGTLLHEKENPS